MDISEGHLLQCCELCWNLAFPSRWLQAFSRQQNESLIKLRCDCLAKAAVQPSAKFAVFGALLHITERGQWDVERGEGLQAKSALSLLSLRSQDATNVMSES